MKASSPSPSAAVTYELSASDIRDAVAVSGIDGVTFGVERVSDTEITVKLEFNGTDFDTDATLTFTVGADALAGYNGSPLTTQIPVAAVTAYQLTKISGDEQRGAFGSTLANPLVVEVRDLGQ